MGTWPLDLDDLLATLADSGTASFDGLPAGTTMGHVHLRVADVDETVGFYRDLLGFDLMAQLGAAGGVPERGRATTITSARTRGRAAAPTGAGGHRAPPALHDRAAGRGVDRDAARRAQVGGAEPRGPVGQPSCSLVTA